MTRLDEVVDIAIEQAARSTGNFRHGCAITSGKKIISYGHNHMRKNVGTYSIHAEMDALWKIYDSDLYENKKAVIIRLNESGKLANSRPCSICMQALKQHGVKTIVYSTVSGQLQMETI